MKLNKSYIKQLISEQLREDLDSQIEKKDHDGDGDIDSDDYMAAKDKAIKANTEEE